RKTIVSNVTPDRYLVRGKIDSSLKWKAPGGAILAAKADRVHWQWTIEEAPVARHVFARLP
ncbi:MAG: hypothetical protein WBX22_27655, partial [Silvibacterium sp.]